MTFKQPIFSFISILLCVCELGEEELEKNKTNAENVIDAFLALVHFHLEERSSFSSAYFLLDSSIHPVSTL